MRATWFTSLLTGAAFGAITGLDDFSTWYAWVLPAVSIPVAVFGLPQLRETFMAGRQWGDASTPRKDDIRRHYLPAWGRLALWFAAAIAAAWIERGLGW